MNEILAIGITLVMGVLGASLAHKLKLPSLVGWLIVGAILGPSALGLYTKESLAKLGFLSDITLGLIGFIIGIEITIGALRKLGGGIVSITLAQFFGAVIFVFLGVLLLTHNLALALLFGALASATAPAGTVAVLEEYRAKGPLTKALYIIVGVDDALAIIIFAFAASYAKMLIGGAELPALAVLGKPLLEVVKAIVVGGAMGWVFGFFTQKIRAKAILSVVLLGTIFICIGLSKSMNFSLILSTVVLGMVIANTFPRVCVRTREVIGSFMPPFYVCFFALAGAHLNFLLLLKCGTIGIIYIICRSLGKLIGAYSGAVIGKEPMVIRKYLGFGLISQAGVAVSLSYLIVREFASLGTAGQNIATLTISIIVAADIIFEIVGPIATKFAITKAGEVRR